MAEANRIERVAIVGAGGHLGKHFVEELLKTGNHTVTAITRTDSKGNLPAGVKVAKVNYDDDGESLATALQGQQFLVITLSVFAPPDLHIKIVQAAVKAGIQYIMPNFYGSDVLDRKLVEEKFYPGAIERLAEVKSAGASYIALTCGFWYEWSLGLGEQWFGFDIKNRTVTFFDNGKTMTTVSTWKQCGRALAALLNLPESGASPALSQWKNKHLYISSFKICQRDMLDSLHRVLGTTDDDWKIKYEPSRQRFEDGVEELKRGVFTGFAKGMYSRNFYPNDNGDHESVEGMANELIGLPKEDLDEATKRTVDMVESGWNPFAAA